MSGEQGQGNSVAKWAVGVLGTIVLAWMSWMSVQVWQTRIELAELRGEVQAGRTQRVQQVGGE